MAKFRSIKNSLTAGEVSESAVGRTDLAQLAHACRTLRNMIPLTSGGAYRRPGTLYEFKPLFSTYCAPRLIPFVVSQEEAYCLALGTAHSTLSSDLGTFAHFRSTSNVATSTYVEYANSLPYRLATAANGYKRDEVHEIQYLQSADVMWLVHYRREPIKLSRTGTDAFAASYISAGNGVDQTSVRDSVPYRAQNTSTALLAISNATVGTGRTLTATLTTGVFNVGHIGSLWKIQIAGTIGLVKVTGYTSPTVVTVTVLIALASTATTSTWWESAWSDYRGWPRAIAMYQQRLAFLGNSAQPDTVWFSQTSNYSVMSVDVVVDPNSTPTGSQPFTVTLSSQELNQLQWGVGGDTLVLGTLGDEWILRAMNSTAQFACSNVVAIRKSTYGSSHQQPVRAGNEILFRSASDFEVNALIFNQLQDSYSAEPVQIFYSDKPELDKTSPYGARKFRQAVWDASRKTLWCIDTKGNLFGMTRDKSIPMTAWHSHRLGGYDSTDSTSAAQSVGASYKNDPIYYQCSGSVVSLAVVPNPISGFSDLWMVVKRKINGSFVYYIERMIGGQFNSDSAYTGAVLNFTGNYFSDCVGYGPSDLATTAFTGSVTHLEAKAVEGTAIGLKGIFPITATVTSGVATLSGIPSDYNSAAYGASLGLHFDALVEPLRPEAGSQVGTAMGSIGRVHQVALRLFRYMYAKVGDNSTRYAVLDARTAATPMSQSAEVVTGLVSGINVDVDYSRDGYLSVLSDQPLPFAISSIILEGNVSD